MKLKQSVLFLFFLFCLSGRSYAQLWSGIISSSRAINWTNAGIPGGIPNRTTQCGSTIAPYSGSASTINTAIANCTAGDYVSLGAGTFNLSSGIDFTQHSNVTLRGQGANSTFLVFTGAGAGGYNSVVAMEGSVSATGYENNVCDWTAGYSQGTTVITLANCGTTTPAVGSLSNLKVGTLLVLDQLDETADTGQIWNCETVPACTWNGPGGEARSDGPCNGSTCYRSQEQGVVVTGISGSSITISPGLYMPNWRSGQLPQAYFPNTTVTGDGLENVSIDATNSGSGQSVTFANATQCWVKGVRELYANRSHVRVVLGSHLVIQNNYFYENISHASVSYGAEFMGGWDSLLENNIFQQDTDSEPSCSGACAGNVIDYNFSIDNVYGSAGWMQAGFYQHSAGDVYNLWEGNIGPGYTADDIHGTHHFETLFRNYLIGNQIAGCGSAGHNTCTAQTIPVQTYAGSRYMNFLGNLLGQSGYHTVYACAALTSSSCSNGIYSIYALGYTGNSASADTNNAYAFCGQPSCTSTGNFDPQVFAYAMRWGNYDVVTGTVRWCGNSSDTGWATTCASTSEVPTSLASYSNAVPTLGDTGAGQSTMPASFYYSSAPSWWPSGKAWPPNGPDVSSGNLGVCSGGTYATANATASGQCTGGSLVTAMAGHANSNPAMDCYLNTMGGPPDGSGSVLTFNANTCYPQGPAAPPAAPASLVATSH
jgi:hypothetical protein